MYRKSFNNSFDDFADTASLSRPAKPNRQRVPTHVCQISIPTHCCRIFTVRRSRRSEFKTGTLRLRSRLQAGGIAVRDATLQIT